MADLEVRNLDDHVATTLQMRAEHKGIPLEEEVRRVLTASVAAQHQEYLRRLKALRAAATEPVNAEGGGARRG